MNAESRAGNGRSTAPGAGAPRAESRQPARPLPGKYGHGIALTPMSESLTEAFLRLAADDALRQLVELDERGWPLADIENLVMSPALNKIGEMWLRGRIDEGKLEKISGLAESVERQFHVVIAKQGR